MPHGRVILHRAEEQSEKHFRSALELINLLTEP